jgi:hypothetical protein
MSNELKMAAAKKVRTVSETGHAKNTANFRQIITTCRGYGTTYNPARTELTLTALDAQADVCDAMLDAVRSAVQVEKDAISNRDVVFKDLSKYATRIINALAAFNQPDNVMQDARSLVNKLTGRRSGKVKTTSTGAPIKTISVSQMSFDMRIDNFEKVAKLVSSLTNYNPNEVEVQAATITAHVAMLRALNQTAANATNAVENARILRDKALYTDTDSMYNVAANIKNYAKYLFGATSPEFKLISNVAVTNKAKK